MNLAVSRPTKVLAGTPGALAPQGKIGPNAVLQLMRVMDHSLGRRESRRLLAAAGMAEPPGDGGLMDQRPAAALHHILRVQHPEQAGTLLRWAGLHTADYIIANRIPRFAAVLLGWLPKRLAMATLSKAIARNAWTFAGSGEFSIRSNRPLVYRLENNPMVMADKSEAPLCTWHSAVFEQLFRELIDPALNCREVTCCAAGDDSCQFTVY